MTRTKCSSSRRISRNSIRSVHSRFCFKPSLFQILLFVQRIPFGFPRDFRQEVRPSPPHAAFSLSERSNQSVHRLLPPFQILSFHINHRTEFHINHRTEFHINHRTEFHTNRIPHQPPNRIPHQPPNRIPQRTSLRYPSWIPYLGSHRKKFSPR